eukprot:TRINITY_DN8724_c1_g4_i1.p1 TRINITY_DN8724_c1_g4~~TRINITY_DN8724_c1_g4_i1.p1  ORF type:complete len:4579 (+),score=2099.61 TRINITY_DN8724_c1_g4_i1:248-13984(+)
MDHLYKRKAEGSSYPRALYTDPTKDDDAGELPDEVQRILGEVWDCAKYELPHELRNRITAIVDIDEGSDDSNRIDEKRWTTVDLPLSQHEACSYEDKDNMQHCGNGRLNSPEGWICDYEYQEKEGDDAVWYKLDAGSVRPIGGVVVKTHNDDYKWWCYFFCEWSLDGEEWHMVDEGEEFAGPDDCDCEEKVYFEDPPTARYLRIKGGGPYDDNFAGRFGLLIEVSDTETINFLAAWTEINGQYLMDRLRAFFDKHCEKMTAGATNALNYFFKAYKRLVEACSEDICDAQGVTYSRLLQLITYDLKYEKRLPHWAGWEMILCVKDVDTFSRIVFSHREDMKARQAALMNQVGQILTLSPGTPDINEFHLVENPPLDAFQLWETRAEAKKNSGNALDKKLETLKATFDAGALKENEYKNLCTRAEMAEMSMGWMFPHDDDVSPVYTHPIYTAEFLSSHFNDDVPSFQGMQAFTRLLRDVILDQQHWLGMNHDEFSSLQFALRVFSNSIPIFQRYSKYMRWQYHTHLDLLIHDIGEMLDSMLPGQAAIFPVTKQPMLMIVEVKTVKLCRVTIVNTNPHTEFHPKAADVPARIRQQTCVSLDNVDFDLLKEKGWWFFAIPFSDFGAEHIFYTHYLNWLHPGRTYESMIAETYEENETRTASAGGGQLWKAYHHAAGYILGRRGVRDNVRRLLKFNIRHKLLNWVVNDLHVTKELPSAHRRLIRLGCEQIAASAAKCPGVRVSKRHLRAVLDCLQRVNDTVARLSPNVLGEPPPLLDLDSGVENNVQSDFFPSHEYLRRIDDIEHLIGERVPDVDFLPANFLMVPDRVANFEDALAALRNSDMLCTRCMVQRGMIRNRVFLCVSLIQHLFIHVLPLPRWKHKDCIWQAGDMTYSQQMEALLVIQRLMEHWASCCFSLRATPEFDAVRITVAGAMAVTADCVLRQLASDRPSRLSTHLRGWRDSAGFAFTAGHYAKQSETIKVTTPEIVIARTIILDYFEDMLETIPTDHYIFMWESGLDRQLGCQRLMFQLAKAEAFSLGGIHEYMYSANDPHYLINKTFPEFKAYRDIVFFYKFFMNTLPGGFPSVGEYTMFNAQLRWQFNTRTNAYEVQAFGKYLNTMAKPNRHRWPSYALASRFTYPHEALTEDDILHIKSLPSFGDVVGQRDSELLLSYLTVPYLRIPLVLNFFATEDRVSLLRAPSMQQLLDSVLFEPGRYQKISQSDIAPKMVPTEESGYLATPFGLLINELQHSPEGVITPLLQLLNLAIELDSGTVLNETAVDVMLYLVRLLSRAYNYLWFLISFSAKDGSFVAGWDSHELRNLTPMSKEMLSKLRLFQKQFQKVLSVKLCPMLETWTTEAMDRITGTTADGKIAIRSTHEIDKITILVAKIQAHVVILRRTAPMNTNVASSLLSSIIFLTLRHTWNSGRLIVPETEVYETMQLQRRRLASYLCAGGPNVLTEVLDGVVRVATSTGGRKSRPEDTSHLWAFVGGYASLGRFTYHCANPRKMVREEGPKPALIKEAMGEWFKNKKGEDVSYAEAFEGKTYGLYFSAGWCPPCRLFTPILKHFYARYKKHHPDFEILFVSADRSQDDFDRYYEEEHGDWLTIPYQDSERRKGLDLLFDNKGIPSFVIMSANGTMLNREGTDRVQRGLERVLEVGGAPPPLPDLAQEVRDEAALGGVKSMHPVVSYCPEYDKTVEVSIMTFQFTFKSGHLKALPTTIANNLDVRKVFEDFQDKIQTMQCATIEIADYRNWYRLVGRDHDVQEWQCSDGRVVLPQCDREYPEELEDHEMWIKEYLDPIRRKNIEWAGYLIYMPEKPLKDGEVAAYLEAVDFFTGEKKFEIYCFKHLKCAQVYAVYSYGRRYYRSMIYATDARYSLRFVQPDYSNRQSAKIPVFKREAGDLTESLETKRDCIVLRQVECALNRAGCVEQYIPKRLLYGLLPQCILETHLFWQDAQDCLRGYPIYEGEGAKPRHLLFVQLRDVKYKPLHESFTVARIIRYAEAQSCPKTRERKKLYEGKKNQAEGLPDMEEVEMIRTSTMAGGEMAREMSGDFSMSGRQTSSFAVDADQKPQKQAAQVEDQDLLLLNLLHAREGTPLYSLAQLLIRMEDLSHILVWTSNLNLKDGEPIDLTWVHLPRLKLSFKGRATAEGTQLVSLDHGHLFISNFRNQLLVGLIQCAPHSLLLQDVNGAMSVLVPAFALQRPQLMDNPFTTELVINKADHVWLDNCDTKYFLYPVHISLSFLLTPTLGSSLYLLFLSFLGRLYEDSFRIAGTVGTDASLTEQESQIFDSIGRIDDIHPEAHACRCRISLQTVDSPLELKWYTPKEVYHYLCKRSKIAATCRLNKAEEALLMWLVDTVDKKMSIIEEHAKREKNTWRLVAERISYDTFTAMLDGSLNERRAVKGFVHGLQKALREELHLRCPANDVVRLCKMYIRQEGARSYCKKPAVAKLLRNHTVYVKAEEEGLEFADVEVPPLGQDKYMNFDAHYEHLSEPMAIKLYQHTFQKQIRGSQVHDTITNALEMFLAGSNNPNDVCGNSRPNMTFLFFIELLTGETALKVKKETLDGRVLFWLLTPFLYYCTDLKNRKWDQQKLLVAMLQAIKHNPALMDKLPQWAPDRRDSNIRNCKNWNDSIVVFATFMRETQNMLRDMQEEGTLLKPDDPNEQQKLPEPIKIINVIQLDEVRLNKAKALLDTACLPILSDSACAARRLDAGDLTTLPKELNITDYLGSLCKPEQLAAFASLPLQVVGGLTEVLQKLTREARGLPTISKELPFDVSEHPTAKNQIAQLMLDRLHDDMAAFADKSNEATEYCLQDLGLEAEFRSFVQYPENVSKIIDRLEKLKDEVTKLHDQDSLFLENAIPTLLKRVNEVPVDLQDDTGSLAFLLRRFSRLEVEMWLEYVLGSLISSDLTGDLTKLNPFLTPEIVAEVTQIAMMAILVTSRVGHANKVREELTGILELLKTVEEHRSESHSEEKLLAVLAALQQKSGAVARTLTMSRSYLTKETGKESYMFDPRFMLFEFTWNIVLRGSQITMVKNFVRSLEEGKSHVKQMIMGAGKTTVVGPLVVLMSADGKRLMMQVVPPSLLDFSRGVLRSTFGGLIPKQIYSFVCDRTAEIDAQVVSKFLRAAEARGVVVTTPSSLKSIYLKFVEGLDRIEDKARPPPPPEHETETRDLKSLLSFWRDRSVLVMDEVDLLLHPLKSELNFPIGEKHDLPLAPVRWRLPIHLLDAIFYYKLGRISVQFKDSPKAKEILKKLNDILEKGFERRALQDTPHVILLNLAFYAEEIKPVMAQWLYLWLEAHHVTYLSEEDTLTYLTDPQKRMKMAEMVESTVPKHDIQLLNMGFDWLHAFLPHTLQKIDRVSFGIMTPFDIDRALEENPQMPRSRIKLAIPFIGKDLPSQSSEFAHPDVVIGLSVLAYRYEGLREADFTEVLKQVQSSVEKEVGKYSQRKTNKMYEKWIDAANGKLLVNFDYQKGAGQDEEEGLERGESALIRTHTQDGFDDPKRKQTMVLAAYAMAILAITESMFVEVVPLRKLKQSNREEVDKLFKLLRLCPEVVHWFLEELVFPEYLRHQVTKLSASGQEIGSNVIFKSRIGFSGTPSDLLPQELGKCDYEKCTDGQLIHTLTSPQIVSYHLVDKGWTVPSILDSIANQNPPFHALIDTGALITGLSNVEVAQYFMSDGRMPQMEGCVFLDELDRKMILVRASGRVIKLEECGIPKLKRFTFYDQVHTTGLDVSHTPNAQAALTLGKDMTFRDFAQGAYRMRGIGTGQTIDLIVIPEVYDLIRRELKLAGQECPADPPADSAMCMDEEVTREVLVASVAWLMINSMRTEKLQYNQLCIQKTANVYRKEAFNVILENDRQFSLIPGVKPTEHTLQALNIYREPIQFQIPDYVPQDELFVDVLQKMVDNEKPPHRKYINAEGMKVVDQVLAEVRAEKQKHQENHDVQMVQEQEEEKEELRGSISSLRDAELKATTELNEELHDVKAKLAERNMEYEAVQEQLNSTVSEMQTVFGEKDILASKQRGELEATVRELEAGLTESTEECRALWKKTEELRGELASGREHLAAAQAQRAAVQEEMKKMGAKLARAGKSKATAVQRATDRLAEAELKRAELKAQHAVLLQEFAIERDSNTEHQRLTRELEALLKQERLIAEDLLQKTQSQERVIDVLKSSIASHEASVAKAQHETAAARESLEVQRMDSMGEKEMLRAKVKAQTGEITLLMDEVTAFKTLGHAETADLKQQIRGLNAELAETAGKVNAQAALLKVKDLELLQNTAELKSQNEQLRLANATFEGRCETLTRRLGAAEEEVRALATLRVPAQLAAEAQAAAETLRSTSETAVQTEGDALAAEMEWKVQQAEYKRQGERHKELQNDMRTEMDRLKHELGKAQEQVAAAENKWDESEVLRMAAEKGGQAQEEEREGMAKKLSVFQEENAHLHDEIAEWERRAKSGEVARQAAVDTAVKRAEQATTEAEGLNAENTSLRGEVLLLRKHEAAHHRAVAQLREWKSWVAGRRQYAPVDHLLKRCAAPQISSETAELVADCLTWHHSSDAASHNDFAAADDCQRAATPSHLIRT